MIENKQTFFRPGPLAEDLVNSITHGTGFFLAVAALVLMVVKASTTNSALAITSVSIFGSALVLLYLMSTLYHALQGPRVKKLFQIFDHQSIYLLIAGSYTPICLIGLSPGWGWSLFGVLWGLTIVGLVWKALFSDRWMVISSIIYLAMGWLAVLVIDQLWFRLTPAGFFWLVLGGVLYSAGLIFFGWTRLPFHHGIWHLFVMGGSFCHFWMVYFYLLAEV